MNQTLQEEFFEADRAKLLRWLPWLHLFRSFRIAIGVRQMLLAWVGVMVWSAGFTLITTTLGPDRSTRAGAGNDPNLAVIEIEQWNRLQSSKFVTETPLQWLITSPFAGLRDLVETPSAELAAPLLKIAGPLTGLVQRSDTVAEAGASWALLLWSIVVWSFFGVALSRRAGVAFATGQSTPLRESLRFSGRGFLSAIGGPLMPIVGIGVLVGLGGVIGALGHVELLGDAIVSALWIVGVLISLVIVVLTLGVCAGWPLMIATVGVDATDAFDALSRGFGYIFQRPWYAFWLLLVGTLYAAIARIIVAGVFFMTLSVCGRLLNQGAPDRPGIESLTRMHNDFTDFRLTQAGDTLGVVFALVWQVVFAGVLAAFVYSFFWTTVTIIYFLLRKSEDGVPLDVIYIPPDPKSDEDSLPLAGIPAAERANAEHDSDVGQDPAKP